MKVTGWHLPLRGSERTLRASAVDNALVVVTGDASSGRVELSRLLEAVLYGPSEPGPGQVTVRRGGAALAARPGDPPLAGPPNAGTVRLGDAELDPVRAARWAALAADGAAPATPEIERARLQAASALELLEARLVELAERPPRRSSRRAGPERGVATSGGADPDEPPADTSGLLAEDLEGTSSSARRRRLAELIEHQVLTASRVRRTRRELEAFTAVPSADELRRASRALDDLDLVDEARPAAASELEALLTTAALIEAELGDGAIDAPAPGPTAGTAPTVPAWVQPAGLWLAFGLIVLAIIVLSGVLGPGRVGFGALLGAAALGSALVAWFSPTTPARLVVSESALEGLRAELDATNADGDIASAHLDDLDERYRAACEILQLPLDHDAAARSARRDDVTAYRDARGRADRLENTLRAAEEALALARHQARTLSVQLCEPASRAVEGAADDTTSPAGEQADLQADRDEAARHRFLTERTRLAQTMVLDALDDLDVAFPRALADAATLMETARPDLRLIAPSPSGPVLDSGPSGTTTIELQPNGSPIRPDQPSVAAQRWLADVALRLAEARLATTEDAGPILVDASGIDLGDERTGLRRDLARLLVAVSPVNQVIVFTDDVGLAASLADGEADVSAVELASIRVLVTPAE